MQVDQRLRSLGPPPEDPLLKLTFRQLATSVMGARFRDKKEPPFEFEGYDRLMDIARRARKGQPITRDDDMWVQDILLQGFPTADELIAKAKKGAKEIPEPEEAPKGGEKAGDKAGDDAGGKAPEGRRAAKDGEGAVSFSVKDEGPGMPEDVRARMFEPGFSTKQRGSGVGLAVTRRIVEQHGGAIDVDSAPGAGTSITIRLPAYGSTAEVVPGVPEESDPHE